MSWDVILPFLRPIEHLLKDAEVSDILVNGSRIFVEKAGRMEEAHVVIAEKALQVAIRNIARSLGADISEEEPLLDARLPDGSRVTAVFPPCAVTGTTLAIRKFQSRRFSAEELVRAGALSAGLLDRLRRAVENRRNVLISGSTGAGKTTLLNALAGCIDDRQRVVVIEDTAEIQIEKPNLVRLEARQEQPGLSAVPIRKLLKTTLRLRPDRILLGEVRGEEAFDLLQALNTGHTGTLSTIHADSAELALSKFTTCILQAGIGLPYAAIRRGIADSVHVVVHMSRKDDRRFVSEAIELRRYDPERDRYEIEPLDPSAEREGARHG